MMLLNKPTEINITKFKKFKQNDISKSAMRRTTLKLKEKLKKTANMPQKYFPITTKSYAIFSNNIKKLNVNMTESKGAFPYFCNSK